jgi:CheY-like chemotaxis protein
MSAGEVLSKSTVLVVEDEPLLRMHAVSIIEEAGFTALEADSADEAIELLESHAEIRIVFTDINLPGSMDGLRLAAAIRDRWPPIELIVTSGRVKVGPSDLPERSHFFSKPYDAGQLIDTLKALGA